MKTIRDRRFGDRRNTLQNAVSCKVYERCSGELISVLVHTEKAESILWLAYLVVAGHLTDEHKNRR